MKLLTLTLMFTAALSAGPLTIAARCFTYEECAAQFQPGTPGSTPFPASFDVDTVRLNAFARFGPGSGSWVQTLSDIHVNIIGHDDDGSVYGNVLYPTPDFPFYEQPFIAALGGGLSYPMGEGDHEGNTARPALETVTRLGYGWGHNQMHDPSGFFMLPGGQMYSIISDNVQSLWVQGVFSINDRGQVLLNAFDANAFEGQQFLIVNTLPTPEPSTWLLAAAGLAVVAWRQSLLRLNRPARLPGAAHRT